MWRIFFLILLIFPFIQQRSYGDLPRIIGTAYRLGTLGSGIVMAGLLIFRAKYLKGKKYLIPFCIYFLFYLLTTAISAPSEMVRTAYYIFVQWMFVLFLAYEAERDMNELLTALSAIYGTLIVLNFLTDIAFPGGLYNTGSYHTGHLLGDDNALIFVMLPGVICLFCYSIQMFGKIKWYIWAIAFICAFSLIRAWAASAMVCMTLFIAAVFFSQGKKLRIRIAPFFLFGVFVFAFVVCFFGLSNPTVQSFIVEVLQKDVTLSGRTILWRKSLEIISRHLLFGCGGYWIFGSFWYNGRMYPCHTGYLQVLLDGGIVLLTPMIVYLVNAYRKVKDVNGNLCSYVLATGLSFMLINYITEYSQFWHLFIVLVFIYESGHFRKDSAIRQRSQVNVLEHIVSIVYYLQDDDDYDEAESE